MGQTVKRTTPAVAEIEPEPPKSKAPPSQKVRTAVQGCAIGVQFAGMLLGSKDADMEGWDDYFAMKCNQLAAEMQQFGLTGKLPAD